MPPAHLKAPAVTVERKPGCTGKMGFVSQRDARHSMAKRALSGGIPLSKGGEHTYANLCVTSRSNNSAKATRQMLIWMALR